MQDIASRVSAVLNCERYVYEGNNVETNPGKKVFKNVQNQHAIFSTQNVNGL